MLNYYSTIPLSGAWRLRTWVHGSIKWAFTLSALWDSTATIDRVLSVLGRHMRDFLNGLDNLHEYLKFSYPRMRAPSFICENETKQGLTLHYRSKRRGFVYYTMGQIREVARYFYHKEMHIELVREEILFDTVHVTFQLTFDNRAFTLASLAMTREEKHLPISAHVLFEIFPFCIVFG